MMQILMLIHVVINCGCICGCGYWGGYGYRCGQVYFLHNTIYKCLYAKEHLLNYGITKIYESVYYASHVFWICYWLYTGFTFVRLFNTCPFVTLKKINQYSMQFTFWALPETLPVDISMHLQFSSLCIRFLLIVLLVTTMSFKLNMLVPCTRV